jgi:hypothetical protein
LPLGGTVRKAAQARGADSPCVRRARRRTPALAAAGDCTSKSP